MTKVAIFPDAASSAQAAADHLVALAQEAVAARGQFAVALSGGTTPRSLYHLLAQPPTTNVIPWNRVHVFWGDERCVPPDHPSSNYHMAREALLAQVPLPASNLHRVHGELGPAAAAEAYTAELTAFFGPGWPRFDLILLGMGSDGHTASLFPGSPALQERIRAVVAVAANYGGRPSQRVTLTPPAINAARQVLFLVTGARKAEIVRATLKGPPGRYPAQQIHPIDGQLTWFLDEAAATLL